MVRLAITGQRFGRLIAIEPVGKTKNRAIIWRCRCDCGETTDVPSSHLVNGVTLTTMATMNQAIVVGLLLSSSLITDAIAADDAYCKLYSREQVRAMIRETAPDALPNLTVDMLQYTLTKYWSICLNRDEPPEIKDLPTDGKWVADLWSEIQRGLPKAQQVGSAPATAPPVKLPPKPIPVVKPTPKPKAATPAVVQSGDPQPLCTAAHKKTTYLPNGHSWRCV